MSDLLQEQGTNGQAGPAVAAEPAIPAQAQSPAPAQGPASAQPVDVVNEFGSWLRALVDAAGSDLHVKVGSPPMIRQDGLLVRLQRAPLTAEETMAIARAFIPPDRMAEFTGGRRATDFAYSVHGVGRFRVNVFHQRGSASMVLRKVRVGGPTFEEVGAPPVLRTLSDSSRGLLLVTGPTGSGKTTTLAAMIEHINTTRPVHVVTIEDPIEVMHPDKEASINQREVGLDTESFLSALRDALREDPDVILIGEMRDPETVRAALQAAETGHLVMSTLHTVDAAETVNRVIDFFPPHQQQQIRLTLAGALRGIVCQRLVRAAGGGRVPCIEVLVNNGRVAERIADPMRTSEIEEIIKESGFYGMMTFDQSLLELVTTGMVSVSDALEACSHPHDFQLELQQRGLVAPNSITG